MRRGVWIFLFLLAVTGASADDQIRAAQQQLKDQGFFYGEVDGQAGSETTAAIRRYQIRSGLQVTGALNQETLSSLKITGTAPAAGTNAAPVEDQGQVPAATNPDKEFLQQRAAPAPAPAAPTGQRYVGAANSEPAEQPPGPDFGTFYARTPYETAPPQVQVDTLRRAQEILFRYGYYRDVVDGIPGPSTQRSLVFFQQNVGLARTGRLDMDTLAALRLLPGHQVSEVRSPYGAPLRGIWIH